MNINKVVGYIVLSGGGVLVFMYMYTNDITFMLQSIWAGIYGKINYDWGKEHENKK